MAEQEAVRGSAPPSFGNFLRACSWGWGIVAFIIGIVSIAMTPLYGAVAIVLGVLLLPPVRRMIGRIMGITLGPLAAFALATLIMGTMIVLGRDLRAKWKIEKQQKMALEKERTRQENAFIASYPYVDRDSLRAWRESAADSTTDRDLTLASFLQRQEEFHARHLADSIAGAKQHREDSIASARHHHDDSMAQARQWHTDSIAGAKQHREDSIMQARQWRADSIAALRATRQAARPAPIRETESSAGTYNGHQIFIGPRGGRYYINSNGNKTYIH
jgi:colicin import membrane protein